ncbi:MAG: flagellar hook-associated protein FlgK [Synergistaceae bacterium]|nr:flagellar hook-associated protein FlgK [Synergistaceae bacterium]
MLNSFFGLEMGRRALDYFRRGMETAGHNISNADVEGFSRQRVEASTTRPFTEPGLNRPAIPGQIGTGVQIDAIVRLRDAFLDIQFREENTVKGYWEQIDRAMDALQVYVNEPAGKGFKTSLDEYWGVLQELHKRPDSSSVREEIVEKTKNLTVYLDQLVMNYDEYRTAMNREVKLMVQEVNTIIEQIAALNRTIAQVQAAHGNPNDLMDRRDLLVEKLAKFIDIDVNPPCLEGDGEFKIDLHGKLLVQGEQTRHLVLVDVPGNRGFYDVQVEDNLFDVVSNTDVLHATVEQGAPEAIHTVHVKRLATENNWSLGLGETHCPDRVKPETKTEALNLSGAFRLQIGSQGTRVSSSIFTADPPGNGIVLEGGKPGDEYIFRVSAHDVERLINVSWNQADNRWDISVDGALSGFSTGEDLALKDLHKALGGFAPNVVVSINSGENQVGLAGIDDDLLSIVDIKGDLASVLGIANDAPIITIEVTEEDSLETIRNKINSAYTTSGDLNRPEDWLHASIELDRATDTYYLVLESNASGEAHRINVMGDRAGNLQIAKRLGFLNGADDSSSFLAVSRDAAFTFDGKLYLSESNAFRNARPVPVKNDYSATTMEEVSEGIRLDLKGTGQASITVRHHVKGGAIKGILEARDDVVLNFLDVFDEIAFTLASEMNALHYAGHGMGENSHSTGVAFFTPISGLYGASRSLSIARAIDEDRSLIAAASGDGHGYTMGEGDGSNALRMAQLKQSKVLQSRSSDFNTFYEAFIASLGSQAQRAETMLKNQNTLVTQIDNQRQSIMGVNVDEEMMDIIKFQQAFNAISRYITTIDEMLDRIINGMGIVGR